MYRAIIITVSDRCYEGKREDGSGPVLVRMLEEAGYEVVHTSTVPDEQSQIEAALRVCADQIHGDLILTTGGTGFSPRDVTPEATLAVCTRMTPGIAEAMRYASLQITPRAMLSRGQAGIRDKTLIINLPGSPKAAKENFEAVLPALEHGLDMLTGGQADCGKLPE